MTKSAILVIVSNADIKALRDLLDSMKEEPVSDDPKARTRARILRAATQLFQRHGYRRTSVDEVATEAGVAKGTVYVHFKNKTELLFFAVLEEKKQLLPPFRELLDESLTPEERCMRYFEMSFSVIPRAPLTSKLMSGDREMLMFLEDLDPESRKSVQSTQQHAIRALLSGVGSFDALSPEEQDHRIKALLGILYAAGPILEGSPRSGLSLETYARQLAKILIRGVGAP